MTKQKAVPAAADNQNEKTVSNLAEAFRRESIASAKYILFAHRLRREGYESLAQFFLACSQSELIHAARFARVALFLGKKLETTLVPPVNVGIPKMVEMMTMDKCQAVNDYRRFRDEAGCESHASAVRSFSAMLKAEETHVKYFEQAIASNDFWRNERKQFCVCSLCGALREPSENDCSDCGAKSELFIKFPKYNPAKTSSRDDSEARVWKFEEEFPSILDLSIATVEEVTSVMAEKGWPEKDVFAVNLALMEATANAVEHGNNSDPTKKYSIEGIVTRDFFFCSVRDEGVGFNPDTIPDPTMNENVNRLFGRGLKLIRGFMSRMWFNSRGNAIYMEKFRS